MGGNRRGANMHVKGFWGRGKRMALAGLRKTGNHPTVGAAKIRPSGEENGACKAVTSRGEESVR